MHHTFGGELCGRGPVKGRAERVTVKMRAERADVVQPKWVGQSVGTDICVFVSNFRD